LSQPKSRNTVWRWVVHIVDYGPIILTVFAAFWASYRASHAGVKPEELLQLVLVVLAMLATTQLIDRIKLLHGLDSKVDKLLTLVNTTGSIDNAFLKLPPQLDERIQRATSIAHNGITLVGTSNRLLGLFSTILNANGHIRLLMVDPESTVLEVAAQRFNKHQDHQRLKREALHAVDNFSTLYSSMNPRFELAFFAAVPSYSIWLFDADTPAAEMWVGLYSFRDVVEPWIQLFPHRDGEIYQFFQRQFETMWDTGRPMPQH
jgi:hypothetical protein